MNLSFGEKLRILREEKGINQTEFGKLTGMSQRKISYIECGKYEPSIDDIAAICSYLKVSADWFLGLEKNLKYIER